ncbi:hypothetical protein AUC31_14930 [Planococcus rifietoensis]|uniref:Glycosyl transferase family 1 domain-containing protein n=1 Tax=Planococcus rifietoensis TaxID=200991 RepID=A0A0U2YUA8_9BACL|nr:glycosyltransferase family 4 protein [Planococcus rifietoensis]ALS76413.1 hypothetical protein AUC31_14930 [Planococcus rifietoensis]
MRVWIVSEGEPLPSDGKNVRLRRMGMLSTLMAEQKHEVHWFSSAFHHYKKIQRSEIDIDISVNENLKIHLIKTKGYKKNVSLSRVLHHRKLAKWMKLNVTKFQKPDIIITTLAPLELSNEIVGYANENDIPVVVDIRDLWPEIYYEVIPSWSKNIIKPYIKFSEKKVKKMIKNTDSIIGVTPKFLQYGLDVAEINKRFNDQVFYTSYKPQLHSQDKDIFEEEWTTFNLNSSDFIVAFLGNFGKQFEFEPIIEAAQILKDTPNVKFVLCGLGESFDEVKKKTEYLDNVIMPGWIEKEKINTLLRASSMGIAPYRKSRNFIDNTPNKFGEYLSASLPVLLSIDGVMAELSREYGSGTVYKNGLELASKIKYYSNNTCEVELMSERAIKLFNEKFNADIVYGELSSFLVNIAEKKH